MEDVMVGTGGQDDDSLPDAFDEHDAEIARLQRIAFGSGATDAEREAAVRELAEAGSPDGSPMLAVPRSAGPTMARSAEDASSAGAAPVAAASAVAEQAPTRIRWAIIAGAIALAAGLLIGWQLDTREPALEPAALLPTGSAEQELTYAEYLETLPLVADAEASEAFARVAVPSDQLPASWVRDGFFQARLLVALPDGTGVFAARREAEVCLIVASASEGGQSRCTENGRFPETGIRVISMQGEGWFDVTWAPDGTVSVTSDTR
ncbi:hypothetical protein [Agromyces sp. Marseille-Q5079]|uniref:hypothetical protein n=1 Tax=Agromyces sp. Marseille-Q5079 TaxID=3439059 RepID=UPI003D9C9014